MKTKITILALFVALFGFASANAQGRGKYKHHKKYEKHAKKYYKHYKYDNRERNRRVVYGDYYGSRHGTVYYPQRRVVYYDKYAY